MGRLVELLALAVVLVAVALCNVEPPNRTIITRIEVPQYAEAPIWSPQEVQCLADVIYGESRGEPLAGQLAVGTVVINRSLSPKYPHDLCKVAHQKAQFFTKKSPSTQTALSVVEAMTYGGFPKQWLSTTHFKSGKKTPTMYKAKYVMTIGHHHFYG